MKKVILAAAAASILFTGSASAADLRRPVAKAPVAVAPIFTWTGCYIGGNVGYARGDVSQNSTATPAFVQFQNSPAFTAAIVASSHVTNHPDGVTVGGGVGCNYQTGAFVIGVEGDINYSDISFSQIRGPFPTPNSQPHTWEESFRSNWFATIRGRAGVTFAERHLLYVTGGAAFAEYNGFKALDFPGFVGFRYAGAVGDDHRVGWVVGVGWEYAFNNNWSAKAEYLHMDFGSQSVLAIQSGNLANNLQHNFKFREDVVRVGLNYRFGWAGPVVAKY
jgi:outer membrane immunogenic protein